MISTTIVIVGVAAPATAVVVVVLLAAIWLGVVTWGPALVVSARAANLLDMCGHRRLIGLRHHHGTPCVHVHVHIRKASEVGCSGELLLIGIILRLLLHAHPHHLGLHLLEHGLVVRVIHV